MAGTVFSCCTDHRRATLRTTPSLNGIDFLEVADLAPGELDADEAAEYASCRSPSATGCSGSDG